MDKKGIAEHVDWVIAVAIFFVYLTIVLTFFKPGIKPMINPNSLLDIVEENFKEDVTWTLVKTPIFLYSVKYEANPCLDGSPPPSGSPCSAEIGNTFVELKDFSNNIQLVDFDEEGNPQDATNVQDRVNFFYVNGKNLVAPPGMIVTQGISAYGLKIQIAIDSAPADLVGSTGAVKIINNLDLSELLRTNKLPIQNNLIFQTELTNEKQTYVAISSSDIINSGEGIATSLSSTLSACSIKDITTEGTSYYADNTVDFDFTTPEKNYQNYVYPDLNCPVIYEVGTREILEGINWQYFINLYTYESSFPDRSTCSGEDYYQCVKKSWGFPDANEFKIVVYDQEQNDLLTFPVKVDPPLDSTVNTRYFHSFILSEDGVTIPVIVSIRVW